MCIPPLDDNPEKYFSEMYSLKKKLNLKVGDFVNILSSNNIQTVFGNMPRSASFKVVGFFNTGMYEYDSALIFVPIEIIQSFLNMQNFFDFYEIQLENFDELSRKRKIIDVTNFEWTEIKEIARIIAGTRNIIPTERKDNTQTVHNEPNDFILQYWKPTIDLKTGIQLITDELGKRY